jgi:hypothetical protein
MFICELAHLYEVDGGDTGRFQERERLGANCMQKSAVSLFLFLSARLILDGLTGGGLRS